MQENILFMRSEITQDGKPVYQLVDEAGNDKGLFAVVPVQEWEADTGAFLITAERWRQVNEEGYTPEHDDKHMKGEIARAALCYLLEEEDEEDNPLWWPWDWEWWKPADRRRNLVKAGALIAAEIDRLKRLEIASASPRNDMNEKEK